MNSNHSRAWRRGVLPAVLTVIASMQSAAAVELVGRYSVLHEAATTHTDPLAIAVNRHLGPEVVSVEDAVRALLLGTGFSLPPSDSAPAERAAALAVALPIARREIHATTVREALQLLVGPGLTLVEDPAHHLVSFEPCVTAGGSSR